jgi:hypothetical protein
MNKVLSSALLAGLTLLSSPGALAHGSVEPRHGGIVATASDLGFELVGTPGGVAIYVQDHGKPMAPTGMSGRLTVLKGSERSQTDLAVVGDRFEAQGVKLTPGARVVAALTTPDKKAITVRFTVN